MTYKLGWINCDYFIDAEDNIDIIVNKPESGTIVNYLVFEDINSIMRPWEFTGDNVMFENIPHGSQVKIIGVSLEDQNYQLAVMDRTLEKDGEEIQLDYKKASLEEIEELFKSLDG